MIPNALFAMLIFPCRGNGMLTLRRWRLNLSSKRGKRSPDLKTQTTNSSSMRLDSTCEMSSSSLEIPCDILTMSGCNDPPAHTLKTVGVALVPLARFCRRREPWLKSNTLEDLLDWPSGGASVKAELSLEYNNDMLTACVK